MLNLAVFTVSSVVAERSQCTNGFQPQWSWRASRSSGFTCVCMVEWAYPVISYRSDTQWTQCGYRLLDGLSNIWTMALQQCDLSLATHCNYNVLTNMCMGFIRWQYSLQWVMKQNWHRQNAQLFKGSFTQLPPFTIPTMFMTITVIPHFSVYIDDSQPNDYLLVLEGAHTNTCTRSMIW